jgi:hypothetical protein
MDFNTVLLQQSRIAAFVVQMLSTTSNLLLTDDVEIRLKTPYHQRLNWDRFVADYKDCPLFCQHLRMLYQSFLWLLAQIRDRIDVDGTMGDLRGGKILPE